MTDTNDVPVKNYIAPEGTQKAYSRYWRKNCSRLEVNELAAVLSAMRKVAGHIGSNVKPIYWEGMSASPDNSIILNPAEIRGNYPVPFRKIDLLVGEVIREAFCCIEWSDWVKNQLKQQLSPLAEGMKDYLSGFISVAEDIYIDERVRPTVWRLYLAKYWKSIADKTERDPSLPPTAASLASIWRKRIFLQTLPPNLHPYYDDLIAIMLKYSDTIRDVKNLSTLAERRSRRVGIYIEMWDGIYSIIKMWERLAPSPEGTNIQDESGPKVRMPEASEESERGEDQDRDDNKEEEPPGLDEELAAQVSFKLDEGESDLTQHISVAIEDPQAKQMNTTFSRGVAKCTVSADRAQVERLKRIFKKQKTLIRRSKIRDIIRGVDMGKIDARRLYRMPLDGKIFKRRDISGSDYSWNISIVADASASMAGKGKTDRPWTVAEQTFVSLTEAAKGFFNRLEVFGYQEQARQCNVVRLYHEGELYTIMPTGQTPTGQAIMAAAVFMKKDDRRKLIIHITDGAANCGLNVVDALEYCQKNRIELITIGCGCNLQTRQFLLERYPRGTVYLMDDIRNLPEGLENLFRDRLLKKSLY
ncbi:MAG: VWA domain-containing protein [Syntrophales bacterium]|nr:VWA domain-containing protein [Syntrophales bacterium]